MEKSNNTQHFTEGDKSTFEEILYQWQSQFPLEKKDKSIIRGQDERYSDLTVDHIDVVVRNITYNVPASFTDLNYSNIDCWRCNASDRVDKKTKKEANKTEYLCIANYGKLFIPVCQSCKDDGLYAHNYFYCIDGYVDINNL